MEQSTPWNEYGLLAYLARRLENKKLGKTKLQKLVYFLLESRNVPLNYRYRFYTYGPYSDTLSGDLDYLSTIGALKVTYDAGVGGYNIKPGEKAEMLEKKSRAFLDSHKQAVDSVLEHLSDQNVRALELLSTVLYLYSNNGECRNSVDTLVAKARQLKPHLIEQNIRNGFHMLQGNNLLPNGY
jgi:uncharacterized protein YwgA